MTKAEYLTVYRFCHLRCKPEINKCKDCTILKIYKEIYKDETF